jgi:hypothetical protein
VIPWLAGVAGAATLTVTSTSNAGAGSLRAQLAAANPGDSIAFDATTFPPSSVTPIVLLTGLTAAQSGLVLQGDDRVQLTCHAAMTSGSGLTVSGASVEVEGLRVAGCPQHGILVTAEYVEIRGGTVSSNDLFGLVVEGPAASVNHVFVSGVTADANCQAPGGAACAGFGVRRNGAGLGPVVVELTDVIATDQVNGGHGFALFGGESATVTNASAIGNAGHGLVCSATSTQSVAEVVVAGGVVHSNVGSGLVLGARCNGAQIVGARVGTDGAAALGNGGDGIQVFGSDDHRLVRNVVADNAGAGISVGGLVSGSPPERLTIEDNVVGLSADQQTALGNGADGVTLTGATGVGAFHSLVGNVVAANVGDGVKIAAQEVVLTGNWVGTNRLEEPGLGNGGDGVEVTTGGTDTHLDGRPDPDGPWLPNVVSYNGGHGVRVATFDVQLSDNRVGRN